MAAFNDSSKGKGTDSPSPQRFDLESATLQTVKMVSGLCQSFFSHLPALAAKKIVDVLGSDNTDGEIFQLGEGQFRQATRGGG